MTAADLDLEALREVVAKGTSGPDWQTFPSDAAGPGWGIYMPAVKEARAFIQNQEDAELIVAAVNALPTLLNIAIGQDGQIIANQVLAEEVQRLTADRDGLREELKRTRHALGDAEFNANEGWKWHKHAAELCKTAEAEVARYTAVVQGVREGIETWATRLHGIRWEGKPVSDRLRALAGGTDTPKACCTCPPDCGPDDCVTANCAWCLHGCPAPEECCADTEGDA